MNATEPLTDDLIQAAFERRADRADQHDLGSLRTGIVAATGATRQRSTWSLRLAGARPTIAPRPTWVAIAVLAALLALGLALVLIAQRPSTPFRTGLLAFVHSGDVYLAHPDGSNAEVAVHQDGVALSTVAWSPDGSRLAIDGDSGAVDFDLATGAATFVGGWQPVWSPDGRELAVLDALPATNAPCAPCTDKALLRIVDGATGTTSRSYPVPAVAGLAWSPNGLWIAATGGAGEASNGLIRIDVATGQWFDLDGPSGVLESPREAAWSPDSTRIAFVRWGGIEEGFCEGRVSCVSDVFIADADGRNAVRLNAASGQADQPAWSPDGQWVAYRKIDRGADVNSTTRSTTTVAGLVIARPDGTEERAIAGDAVESFAWSAEGDRLRFTRDEGPELPPTIWETTLDGVARRLDVPLDSGVVQIASTGLAAAWQAVASATAVPALPSIAPPAVADALKVMTPGPAAPADPSAEWSLLGSDATEGCQPILIATDTGAVTPFANLCDPALGSISGFWSPDGSAFAGVRSGQLVIVGRDGRTSAAVSGLSALDSLTWSPDGTWLMASGSTTDLLRSDGSGLHELPGPGFWSPDGRVLAVWQRDGPLLVGAGDGSGLTPIGSLPPPITWTHDGSRFAFIRDGDVWTAARDGTDVRNLTALPLRGATLAAWSPDDRWVAVAANHGVWLISPDGTKRRWLDFGVATFVHAFAWSPDGRRLAVETYMDHPSSGQEERVYLVDADGSTTIEIGDANAPSWSPDGRFLLVTHVQTGSAGGYDTGDFELMNADGSGRRDLPAKAGQGPAVWLR
jgi:Tol biopolymer transport system component